MWVFETERKILVQLHNPPQWFPHHSGTIFPFKLCCTRQKLFCLRSMPRWGDNESIPIFTVKRWAEDLSNFDQGFQAQPCHSNCKSNFVVGLKGVCDSEGVDGCEALRAITIWWVSPYFVSSSSASPRSNSHMMYLATWSASQSLRLSWQLSRNALLEVLFGIF